MTTVKANRNFSIDERLDALRLQVVASEMARRIGRAIRRRRKELDLTQKQVAAEMRKAAQSEEEGEPAVDGQRVSDWERGYNKPSERYLHLLVAALKVEGVGYFYEDEAPGAPETPDVLGAFKGDDAESRLERIETQVSEIRDALLGNESDAQAVAGIAARLLQAAGLLPEQADDPPQSPPAARQPPPA
jgi:transcriptional regulator with XRE-family HTH domain